MLHHWCITRGAGGASAPQKFWFGENPWKSGQNLQPSVNIRASPVSQPSVNIRAKNKTAKKSNKNYLMRYKEKQNKTEKTMECT